MNTHILHNSGKRTFVVSQDTLSEYISIQADLMRRDILNHSVYPSALLHGRIKNLDKDILEHYASVGHRILLITYYLHNGSPLSLLEAATLGEQQHLASIKKGLETSKYILVNENGGYSYLDSLDSLDGYNSYNWISSNIIDNDTKHIILENAHCVDSGFMDRVESDSPASMVTNFSSIADSSELYKLLTSRDDWHLWVETQGNSPEMYIKFLETFQDYIDTIHVYSANISTVHFLIKQFPLIHFDEI